MMVDSEAIRGSEEIHHDFSDFLWDTIYLPLAQIITMN